MESKLGEDSVWRAAFEEAITSARKVGVREIQDLRTVEDFLQKCDNQLRIPPEGPIRNLIKSARSLFFVFSQDSLKTLQSPISPQKGTKRLTELSQWIVDFVKAWGDFYDTADSAKYIDSFKADSRIAWDEYIETPSGFLTYNQFFARHVKPGKRPIAAYADSKVIVSPADSRFFGKWDIDNEVCIDAKGFKWSISQLIADSQFAEEFKGGIFTHSFLDGHDYHRFHCPVGGSVVEAKNIKGQASFEIECIERSYGEGNTINMLHVPHEAGFQFVQLRGLVVIRSEIGLVACLAVGTGHVSSVVLTAEVGTELRKGEELGYFLYGGSDFVMVFQKKSKVQLYGPIEKHYLQGQTVGISEYDQ